MKNRLTIKLSLGRYPTNKFSLDGNEWKNLKTNNFRLEGNYGITPNLEANLYLGGQKDNFLVNPVGAIYNKLTVPFFGTGINFHVLPFLIEKKGKTFDLYLFARMGGLFIKRNSNLLYSGFYPEYSAGLGGSFKFLESFGVFSEVGIGKFYFRNDAPQFPNQTNLGQDWYKFRFGLIYSIKINSNKNESDI